MEAFSALLALCAGNSPVPGEFSAQRPVTRSFDVFFDLRLNKRLSKQPWGWWFETPSWTPINIWFWVLAGGQTIDNDDVLDQIWLAVSTWQKHYSNVMMSAMGSQITSFTIVYSTDYSGADASKHQSSASLAFVRGIHRWPVKSPH